MEGGRIQFSGARQRAAREARSCSTPPTCCAAATAAPATPSSAAAGAPSTSTMSGRRDGARPRTQRRHRRDTRLLLRRARALGRRAPAARVPRLLAVCRRTACVHVAERRGVCRPRGRAGSRGARGRRGRPGPVDHIAFSAGDCGARSWLGSRAAASPSVTQYRARRGPAPAVLRRSERGPGRGQRDTNSDDEAR